MLLGYMLHTVMAGVCGGIPRLLVDQPLNHSAAQPLSHLARFDTQSVTPTRHESQRLVRQPTTSSSSDVLAGLD